MSHYGNYIKEREGYEIVEDDKGFASFIVSGYECYIRDIYVHPDFRKEKVASQYADKIYEIAKEQGCHKLIGSVYSKALNTTDSLKVLLAYGFKLAGTNGDMIYFEKEIK